MVFKITKECLACGVCQEECAAGAIEEGEETFSINVDTCLECGTCKDVCPNDAIVEE